jgi:hypothetical protein
MSVRCDQCGKPDGVAQQAWICDPGEQPIMTWLQESGHDRPRRHRHEQHPPRGHRKSARWSHSDTRTVRPVRREIEAMLRDEFEDVAHQVRGERDPPTIS